MTFSFQAEDKQNELSAWKFTADSATGKRLMAKCRQLYQVLISLRLIYISKHIWDRHHSVGRKLWFNVPIPYLQKVRRLKCQPLGQSGWEKPHFKVKMAWKFSNLKLIFKKWDNSGCSHFIRENYNASPYETFWGDGQFIKNSILVRHCNLN